MANSFNVTAFVSGLAGGFFVLALGPVFGSQGTAASLKAERFELVDAKGEARARLHLENGHPTLAFLDESGIERLTLVHDAEQTGVFVSDKDKQIRAGMALFGHGGAGFALHGEKGMGAAVLYFKGSGSLSFFEPDGKVRLRIPEVKSP